MCNTIFFIFLYVERFFMAKKIVLYLKEIKTLNSKVKKLLENAKQNEE